MTDAGPNPSAAALLAAATKRIGGETPRLDAELLLAHLIGRTREELLLRPPAEVDAAAYAALVERRARGEPVAYITGTREFWSLQLSVAPGVLVPRPDSETLIEAALARAGPAQRIFDLGTGSGALLLAALSEYGSAFGIGVDRSPAAIAIARANAARLGLASRAAFVEGDWASALTGPFDLILCNPPYVAEGAADPAVHAYEPHAALYAGAQGLDAYARIVPDLPRLLAAGGLAVLEIGWDQHEVVSRMARGAGLVARLWRDLGGRPRALALTHGA
jgi:release factor glutamine methyltransferase